DVVMRTGVKIDAGGDGEIRDICERVELRGGARRRPQETRPTPSDAIERGGDGDSGDGVVVAALDAHADRRQAGAKREQGDDVRQDHAQRHETELAEAPAPRCVIWIEGQEDVGHGVQSILTRVSLSPPLKRARTVSPAT